MIALYIIGYLFLGILVVIILVILSKKGITHYFEEDDQTDSMTASVVFTTILWPFVALYYIIIVGILHSLYNIWENYINPVETIKNYLRD